MRIKKEIPSGKEHWQKEYRAPVGNQKKSGVRAFDPMKGKDRPHTHVKVNDQDH